MVQPGRKRARSAEREHAVAVVNAAYVDGQLTAEQREERVNRALVATHLHELDVLTADLRGVTGAAPEPPRSRGVRWWEGRSRATKLAVAGVVLVVAAVGAAVTLDGANDDGAVSQTQEAFVVTASADAVVHLVEQQRIQFDTTRSYGISLQHQLSTVSVPTEDGKPRYRDWNPTRYGQFASPSEVKAADQLVEFDLADLDLEALRRNVAQAENTLTVPDDPYLTLSVAHWRQDEEPRVVISLVNEFDEHGYVVTDLAGRVLGRQPFDPAGP